MATKPNLSICDSRFNIYYKQFMITSYRDIKLYGKIAEYNIIIPERCDGTCRHINVPHFIHNYVVAKIMLLSPNIINHKIWKKLMRNSFIVTCFNVRYDANLNTCFIASFRLFKQQIRYIHAKYVFETPDIPGSIYNDVYEDGLEYIKNFKKHKTINKYLHNNTFESNPNTLRLLFRRHDKITWKGESHIKKYKKIKQLINLILSACTTKNSSKLICYSV